LLTRDASQFPVRLKMPVFKLSRSFLSHTTLKYDGRDVKLAPVFTLFEKS